MFALHEIVWAIIGLFLTIGGTFLGAYITGFPWAWSDQGIATYSLGVTYQIGAVLLVGCLGGKNAGALSQIAYLAIGLTWWRVFAQGGGIGYIKEPTFGYLLGFVPGAWVCGYLAFQRPPKLEFLALSCIFGLLCIHLSGLIYLVILDIFNLGGLESLSLWQSLFTYSLSPLLGQLVIICAVTVVAFILRKLMFY